jgi:hypothetical protein
VVRSVEEQRVAVGRRFRHRLGADVAAGAAAVLDDDRFAPGLLQLLGEQPPQAVGRAARREGHHQAQRFRGKVLRAGRHGDGGEQRTRYDEDRFHSVLLRP